MRIGKILLIIIGLEILVSIGVIAFDVFTLTSPFKEGSITYLVSKNNIYLSLFLLYVSISLSHTKKSKNKKKNYSEYAIAGKWSIKVLAISIVITMIIDIFFTFTVPFKTGTYTYKWWCLLWEYKQYIFIALFIITGFDLIMVNTERKEKSKPLKRSNNPQNTNNQQVIKVTASPPPTNERPIHKEENTNIEDFINSNQNVNTEHLEQTSTPQILVDEEAFLNHLKENPNASINEVASWFGISLERANELKHNFL
ncbi:hypothetical protein [Capnocytophaga bilenii]